MLLRGEGLLAHRGPVVGGRLPQGLADLSELVGEARRPVRHPGHVRPHQDLSVAARARANTDRGDRERLGDALGAVVEHVFGSCDGRRHMTLRTERPGSQRATRRAVGQ